MAFLLASHLAKTLVKMIPSSILPLLVVRKGKQGVGEGGGYLEFTSNNGAFHESQNKIYVFTLLENRGCTKYQKCYISPIL